MASSCVRLTPGSTTCVEMAQLFTKPARDLTDGEAQSVLTYLQNEREISLSDPKKGPGAPRGQLRMSTTIAGVEFWQASGKNGASRLGQIGARAVPDFLPTPKFAVVLYKFAVRLRDGWGASQIVWGGIGQGSGKNAVDCHMKGHCMDFYGATTTRAGVLDVKRDWYLRPVIGKDGKPHAVDAKEKQEFDRDRWGSDTHTTYRLLNEKEEPEPAASDKGYYNARAKEFFCDVYTFISEQCAFGSNDIPPASFKAGLRIQAGMTLHPDYPTKQRKGHMDHVHFQLGGAFS